MNDIKTIIKSNEVLRLFINKSHPLHIKDIMQELNIPQSTVYRIIKTHISQGIIESLGDGLYKPGWVIQALYEPVYPRYSKLTKLTRPLLEEAVNQLGETIILTTLRGNHVLVLDTVESNRNLRFSFNKNEVFLPYYGASSKVLIAFAEENYRNDLINLSEDNNHEKLKKDLENIKKDGYAISYSEVDVGAIGIGVPIMIKKKLIGGLSVAAPEFRIDDKKKKEIISYLKDMANEISFLMQND
ncbi:IclR family transcriptional regulator [Staphylococcus sciuri]|uniref:IclR family transcriptional regulator n=1 Tax=Mammaliicoccus sciuri TaxID=1296 RepID=UPI00066AA94F|nr:IclR family transcriptional regulator [Mammaliicoccus sciuri]MCJ0908043.1 IclR family transcriptional regulator [Mammaliicoccus sciuri]MCJ0922991.1 IclR family transcriptional regulator [Mammaliicoccus sciuri]MDO0952292.1 IclR family transcriptional regulator [Mammaliicoccus sciuri]MEB6119452.1 IclR family transcriptional regulator [Mammaliicoccus sciuri]NGX75313.1 IclR family transcriptional regulator [Mammaliicoccus sciuri]